MSSQTEHNTAEPSADAELEPQLDEMLAPSDDEASDSEAPEQDPADLAAEISQLLDKAEEQVDSEAPAVAEADGEAEAPVASDEPPASPATEATDDAAADGADLVAQIDELLAGNAEEALAGDFETIDEVLAGDEEADAPAESEPAPASPTPPEVAEAPAPPPADDSIDEADPPAPFAAAADDVGAELDVDEQAADAEPKPIAAPEPTAESEPVESAEATEAEDAPDADAPADDEAQPEAEPEAEAEPVAEGDAETDAEPEPAEIGQRRAAMIETIIDVLERINRPLSALSDFWRNVVGWCGLVIGVLAVFCFMLAVTGPVLAFIVSIPLLLAVKGWIVYDLLLANRP